MSEVETEDETAAKKKTGSEMHARYLSYQLLFAITLQKDRVRNARKVSFVPAAFCNYIAKRQGPKYNSLLLHIARSSNGRTEAFEAFNLGSNPGRAYFSLPQANSLNKLSG